MALRDVFELWMQLTSQQQAFVQAIINAGIATNQEVLDLMQEFADENREVST